MVSSLSVYLSFSFSLTMSISSDTGSEMLVTKRVEIVQSLNCERTLLLNYLRSHQVFDEEDCELILAEKANRHRVGKLLDFLMRKGPEAYKHFIDVVQVENPSLYETLTGMKATSTPSELMRQIQSKSEEVSGFQVQLLAKYLQRTYVDLQEITLKFSVLAKEKQELENKLERAEKNLEVEKARQESFEEILNNDMEFDDEVGKHQMLLLTECDNLQKGVADRDVYIIVLQMKLLAEKDECDKLRSKLDEVEHKNETMARELGRISANYNQERSQSLKLSECIRLQVDEIQRLEDLKKRLRESQFENILIQDERDCMTEELKELQKWAEALKARFDVVEREKVDFSEKNEFVTNNCANLQESVRTLQRKLILSQSEVEDCRKRKELLAHDSEIYKKQRDCALEARKEAILERDKAISEKDIVQKQYNELQAKRDKINEERAVLIQDYDAVETRYNASLDELTRVKKGLNEKELEAEDLSRRLSEFEEKNLHNSRRIDIVAGKPEGDEESSESVSSESTGDGEDENESTANAYPWRERKLKSLLDSMKNRIITSEQADGDTSQSACQSLQVLQCLLPNLNSRPYSSLDPKVRSTVSQMLHRQRGIRRQKAEKFNKPDEAMNKTCSLPAYVKSRDLTDLIENAESGDVETSSSDLEFCERPHYFRQRAKLVSKKYRRSKSAEQ